MATLQEKRVGSHEYAMSCMVEKVRIIRLMFSILQPTKNMLRLNPKEALRDMNGDGTRLSKGGVAFSAALEMPRIKAGRWRAMCGKNRLSKAFSKEHTTLLN
jgi:hypothetical protein